MKWFRKWLTEKSASRTNWNGGDRTQCINQTGKIDQERINVQPEIIDTEDFFDNPEHVTNYREEKKFLDLMSEWVIIENPQTTYNSFFSADFEEELINSKSSLSNLPWVESDSEQFPSAELISSQMEYYDFLWGHRVVNGIPYNRVNKNQIEVKDNGQCSWEQPFFEKYSKVSTVKQSFLSSLCKCSGCEADDSDDSDDLPIRKDYFDIQRYFRLSDGGNILLDMNHIVEEKGYVFLIRRTKKLYREVLNGEAIDENYAVRSTILTYIKGLFRTVRDIFFGHPRNKVTTGGPGESVRSYTLQLANDHTSTFSRNIENFISCTKESREAAPQVVMRNMRQFMNGMKNYLVKHGEGEFHQEVQKARSRLKSDEFLNLDAILETVMHQLAVLPLREHLYGMFVDYYTRSGDIQLLVENVKYACARNALDFGIRPSVAPPSSAALQQISAILVRLQEAELPLEKLEIFLHVIAAIFDATGCPRGQQLGADDFLPVLVYVVAKCGFVGAEIEAEFMWGLLQPALLSGEAGYYLTALCSAVHVLKSFMSSENEGTGSLDWRSSSLPACSSVLRVIIPDECNGSLQTRTLPVRPHTTTREVCRIIAHKARITNPQDYGLFKLVDGEETLLADSECPQDARIAARGKHCMLAYKRIDAKIAWPTATQPSFA